MNKVIYKQQFQALLKDGMSVFVGGFLTCGTPERLIDWVLESGVKSLTIICNDGGMPDKGVGRLIVNKQVKTLIASHVGTNPVAGQMMSEGTLDVKLVPQGTLVEQIRAHGAGLGGILTSTGLHTIVEEGKQVIRVNDQDYLLELSMGADLALIQAREADPLGNLTYAKTARNFNPVMATAAKTVVAYADHHVADIDPEAVVTPHIFVDYLAKEEIA
ncbi:MAG: 3-oxoacid CoA-transferase subunit A [Acholeplasmataceae bacterium]|nr:MAG: 3-oxoacid CoA-transferase subunit A [Acholeplasmataceae bacterium]